MKLERGPHFLFELSLLAVLALGGCATTTGGEGRTGSPSTGAIAGVAPGVTFGGGDGLSCGRRVIIQGTETQMAGIPAEYAWLRARYPGFKMRRQTLTKCDEHPADRLSIETATGQPVDVYFDISAFFGKGLGL